MSAELILQTRGLSVRYGQIRALESAHITVRSGEIVSVIGANGAGKSTLLGAIMGSLPPAGVATGEVLYRGQTLGVTPPEHRISEGLALVPEKRELFASMTIEENLMLGGYVRRHEGRSALRQSMEEIYEIFPRLQERRKQAAGTMSGGERQMRVLGRALMSKPRLLMLDEPSLGLAPLVMNEVFKVIARLRDTGVATLLIEQNSRAALQVSDRAYVLELGQTTVEGTAAEVAANPRVIEAYLGHRH